MRDEENLMEGSIRKTLNWKINFSQLFIDAFFESNFFT